MREVICVRTKTPSKKFPVESVNGKFFKIFYGTLPPMADIGNTGDLWLKQSGSQVAIYWKKIKKDGIIAVWREVGGNGLVIPHPVYPAIILRGGTCHAYPHWCTLPEHFDKPEDDFYQAAHQFLRFYGAGSSSRPIDLTLE